MKPTANVTELDLGHVEQVLDRVEEAMGEETVRPLRLMLQWCLSIQALLQEKTLSISRLRRIVFGPSTERTSDVLPDSPENDEAAGNDENEQEDAPSDSEQQDASSDSEPPSPNGKKPRRRPKKGHGRIPASAYTGCQRVLITHESFSAGDCCPHCQDGTLYRLRDWAMTIRLKGQPPIGGTRYEQERLRCGTCLELQVAPLPEEAGANKYDVTVPSMIALLRYGEGFPWSRIERIQQAAGIPMPASVQWELVRDGLEHGPQAVYEQLLFSGAQGDLIHNDDTRMRVLELTTKAKQGQPLRDDAPERKGIFTTGILSIAEDRPPIALFYTGPYYSGENLRQLLERRMAELTPPVQMCDGLLHNLPGDLETIVANCLAHGRRKFVYLAEAFEDEVRYVLDCLSKVYRTDAAAARFKLSADQRLRLHQRRSEPVMNDLHRWLKEQLEQRKTEPNSSLGQAIQYMLNHWEKLTLFLRMPGVPLDNNLCERALKMAIRHRKNSLFYKTQTGARVGDVYMSLIHTCYFSKVDPFHYMTALQRNEQQVKEHPDRWLPWNYHEQPD